MPQAPDFAKLIDHTLLRAGATCRDIKKLCLEAKRFGFYSVCVNPVNIRFCRNILKDSGVKICAVAGFPLGASSIKTKVFETKDAVSAGADEIDLVLNIGALRSGRSGTVFYELKKVRSAARGKTLKIIIEASLLSKKEKILACLLAKRAGANFVKTSTGFGSGGASAADVRIMRKAVGKTMGVKAAGGIKDAVSFLRMIEAGASRIGTSNGVSILKGLNTKRRGS
jgi:deoxyribose-phosphate aldolase